MFHPAQRIIAPKEFIWEQIKRGEIMNLTFDLETSGFTRQNVPYATPNYPFITEYGDALTDLAGNYLDSAQIFGRRPDWLMFQPGAAILQRMQKMDDNLFDSQERERYWISMAMMAWRLEESAYAYDQVAKHLGDEPQQASFTYYYKTNKGMAERDETEQIYTIPLYDSQGNVVHDVRYHPDRRKVSYRIDENPKSTYWEHVDNRFYIDSDTKSRWKFVEPGLNIDGYNIKPYDIPILRANLYRVGYTPSNSTFLYARGTPTSKQKKKNHILDIRDLAFWTSIAGPQGEDGLDIGRIIDPVTGQLRHSESLGAYLDMNEGQPVPIRFLRSGPFNVHDFSYFDEAMAHGAVVDAIGTAALRNQCWQIAPWIAGELVKQQDKKKLYTGLSSKVKEEDKLQLYSLPVREGGHSYGEMPHYFLGPDDQIGKFGNLIFLLADGTLHRRRYKNKPINDLSVEEWGQYLKTGQGREVVKKISFNRWKGAFHIDDVLQKTAMAGDYRNSINNLQRDSKFIFENEEMQERIKTALERQNHARRFNRHTPQIPLLEDELPSQFSGEVHYQDAARELERRMQGYEPHKEAGMLESLRSHMQNIYEYMRAIDESLGDLALKPHMADAFKDEDIFLTEGARIEAIRNQEGKSFEEIMEEVFDLKEELREERKYLENFAELAERNYKKARKKKWPLLEFLKSVINPATNLPYFVSGKFKAQNLAQAFHFRQAVAKQILQDTLKEFDQNTDYTQGLILKDYNHDGSLNKNPKLLFSDVDNGENGPTPHIVDKHGREIPLEFIQQQDKKDVLNMLNDGRWDIRFYRMRSIPGLTRLLQRMIDLGFADDVPKKLMTLYKADKYRRFHGMPNEDRTTSRIPTLGTYKYEMERLQLSAKAAFPLMLERDVHPMLGEAQNAVKFEEGQKILSLCGTWYEKQNHENPQDNDLIIIGGHDDATSLPLDDIFYKIDRTPDTPLLDDPNLIVLDVPVWHLRAPKTQFNIQLPHRLLAVPQVSQSQHALINLHNRPVILREIETGRLYHTGPGSINAMPDQDDPAFSNLWQDVMNDYQAAGWNLNQTYFSILGIENLYPVAYTRFVNPDNQSLKLPHLQFDALTAPQYAHLGETALTTAIIPLDYCPQTLKPGQALNLREVDADLFATIDGDSLIDTGHSYETILRHVIGMDEHGKKVGITLGDLFDKARSGDISADIIQGAGFMNAVHMEDRLREWVTKKWKSDPDDQLVLLAVFDQVNKEYFAGERKDESKNTWALFNMLSTPVASFRYNKKHIPPHVYSPIARKLTVM